VRERSVRAKEKALARRSHLQVLSIKPCVVCASKSCSSWPSFLHPDYIVHLAWRLLRTAYVRRLRHRLRSTTRCKRIVDHRSPDWLVLFWLVETWRDSAARFWQSLVWCLHRCYRQQPRWTQKTVDVVKTSVFMRMITKTKNNSAWTGNWGRCYYQFDGNKQWLLYITLLRLY